MKKSGGERLWEVDEVLTFVGGYMWMGGRR